MQVKLGIYCRLDLFEFVNNWEKGFRLELNDLITIKLRLNRLGFQTRLQFDPLERALPLLTVYKKWN